MLNLDEYVNLMKQADVKHIIAPQCSCGARARKLTSWVHFAIDLDDMPKTCLHAPKLWYSKDGQQHYGAHPPSMGTTRYFASAAAAQADGYNFYNLGLVPAARLGWIGAAGMRAT